MLLGTFIRYHAGALLQNVVCQPCSCSRADAAGLSISQNELMLMCNIEVDDIVMCDELRIQECDVREHICATSPWRMTQTERIGHQNNLRIAVPFCADALQIEKLKVAQLIACVPMDCAGVACVELWSKPPWLQECIMQQWSQVHN